MFKLVWSVFEWFAVFLRSRNSFGLEIVALRRHVNVLKRKHPRSRLSVWDQVFWVFLRRVWSRWAEVLVLVKPETVVRWHRAGFRLYWRWLSRREGAGQAEDGFRDPSTDRADGERKSPVESSLNPRRACEAGL